MSITYQVTDDTPFMLLKLKCRIFEKWKTHCKGHGIKNIDEYGNEYYLQNAIYCIHILKEAKYKFGLDHSQRSDKDRITFPNGYYVLSTRQPNYTFIEDPDVLHFVFHFDLGSNRSLHKELNRRMKVSFGKEDDKSLDDKLE